MNNDIYTLDLDGYCHCGCRQKTNIDKRGNPYRYIYQHHRTLSPVEYKILENGCWEWQRTISPNGYGKSNGRDAHVAIYERFCGKVPDGKDLDHLCRNRACVNPDHLEPVTRAINIRRGKGTKLTLTQVEEIEKQYASGTSQRKLAREFKVSSGTIQAIVEGRSWKSR